MKRRHFLSAASALLAGQALAAPAKKDAKEAAKKAPVLAGKPGKAGTPAAKNAAKTAGKAGAKPTPPVRPAAPTASEPLTFAQPTLPRSPVRFSDSALIAWRQYEIVTEVSLPRSDSGTTFWLPLPIDYDTGWQKGVETRWSGNFTRAGIQRDAAGDQAVFRAESDGGNVQIQLTSRIAVRDRQFDVTKRGQIAEREDILRRYLRPAPDGFFRDTAEQIVGRIREPMPQARAIYDWLLEHGNGDIQQLASHLDLPANPSENNQALAPLFVALCRAADIPARLAGGIRLDAPDQPHLRAEYYAPYYGWIPLDIVDAAATRSEALRKRMFGYWEMNWMALHREGDLTRNWSSSPSSAPSSPYQLQPWAENKGRLIGAAQGLQVKISARRLD